jgi:hypothetical protein
VSETVVRTVTSITAAVAALVVFASPQASAGQRYVWSIDGSVQNSGLPAGLAPGVALGPNVSSAKDGSRIEIAGIGEFSPSQRSIDGGGEYRIVSADGSVLKSGRWKPTRLVSYRDLGFEHGIPTLIAGVIDARITLTGFGNGRLLFYCGAHKGDEELEGVWVAAGRRFDKIESGSTTIQES